jgi:Peptidase A4 family
MTISRLTSGKCRIVVPVSLLLALTASAATASAATAPAAARPAPAVVFHAVSGCGEPVTLAAPAKAGEQLPARALGLPGGPGSVMAAAAKRRVRWLTTLKCRVHATNPVRVRTRSGGPFVNWAGYEDTTTGPNFVQASWRVPAACCNEHSNDYSSIWPGIGSGGTRGTSLIQDGTEQNMGANGHPSYYAWFEVFPAEGQVQITNLKVRPGNKMSVSSSFNATGASGATFVICNVSRGVCASIHQKAKRPDKHAEWIVERTSLCSNHRVIYPRLAPIDPVKFTGSRFDINGAGKALFTISHAPHARILMGDDQGQRLATPGALTGHGTAFLTVQDSVGQPNPGAHC